MKRGDTITLTGMATPNTTLTITSKHTNGNILAISTSEIKISVLIELAKKKVALKALHSAYNLD